MFYYINYCYIEVDMGHPIETRYLMGGGCGGFWDSRWVMGMGGGGFFHRGYEYGEVLPDGYVPK
jgi:hypothetical protein